jgi:hypothetical protein
VLTALYYPHTTMSPGLVKNALFLWDRIEYIAPWDGFKPDYQDPELSEAVQAFSVPLVPTDAEKQQVDEIVTDLIESGLPEWFYVDKVPENLRYNIYTKKLLERTRERLKKHKLVQGMLDRLEISAPLGMSIMSILADCCAGAQKRLITDEASSYSALNRYLLTIGGGEWGRFDNDSERLVTISLKAMNFKNVKLARLVEIREKEKSQGGAQLRNLRHGYLRKIEEYADKIAKAKNKRDKEEIERIFEQEMKDDFDLLKDELKDEAKKVIISKEMGAAVIALAGAFISPELATLGPLAAGGALWLEKNKYSAARKKVLKAHSTSWLYSIRRLPLL